jgi:hypothetical protein
VHVPRRTNATHGINPARDPRVNYPLLLGGALLVAVAALDAAWTTLWIDGRAGPLARRVASLVGLAWDALVTRRRPRLLSARLPVVLASSIGSWALLLWAGWALVFASLPDAISPGRAGVEHVPPAPATWQIVAALCAASALLLLAMAGAYLVHVLRGVVSARSFAAQVHGLGRSAEQLLRSSWDGASFRWIEISLQSLAEQLERAAAQHHAHPVLHQHRGQHARQSIGAAVCVLDDALTLLACGVAEEVRPAPSVLRSGREAVASFLDTLVALRVSPSPRTPAGPTLAALQACGIPPVHETELAAALAGMADRRRMLLALVEREGKGWPEWMERTAADR